MPNMFYIILKRIKFPCKWYIDNCIKNNPLDLKKIVEKYNYKILFTYKYMLNLQIITPNAAKITPIFIDVFPWVKFNPA